MATPDSRCPSLGRWRQWLRGMLLCVITAMAASLYVYFWISKPVGSGPAGPPVPPEAFQQIWTERPVLALGIGDSVTAGFGASPGLSYFERVLSNPDSEFRDMAGVSLKGVLPNLRARNIAVSGSTSDQHLRAQLGQIETQPPDVLGLVLMTTGGNDLIHNYGRTPPSEHAMYGATIGQAQPWIDAFGHRLEEMVTQVHEKFPGGCHIFLATIYDPTDGCGDPESVRLPPWKDAISIMESYNDVLVGMAGKYPFVHLVDIHAAFLGHGIHCTKPWKKHYRPDDPHYWYNVNLEDPNDRGYDAIRRLFLLEIAKARGSSKGTTEFRE